MGSGGSFILLFSLLPLLPSSFPYRSLSSSLYPSLPTLTLTRRRRKLQERQRLHGSGGIHPRLQHPTQQHNSHPSHKIHSQTLSIAEYCSQPHATAFYPFHLTCSCAHVLMCSLAHLMDLSILSLLRVSRLKSLQSSLSKTCPWLTLLDNVNVNDSMTMSMTYSPRQCQWQCQWTNVNVNELMSMTMPSLQCLVTSNPSENLSSFHPSLSLLQKLSDQFTKLNLSFSLDRANLSAYNPWEMVSRLQTIEWIFNLIKRIQVAFLGANTPSILAFNLKKLPCGNCRVISARLQV